VAEAQRVRGAIAKATRATRRRACASAWWRRRAGAGRRQDRSKHDPESARAAVAGVMHSTKANGLIKDAKSAAAKSTAPKK
jgi:hypothetical protein